MDHKTRSDYNTDHQYFFVWIVIKEIESSGWFIFDIQGCRRYKTARNILKNCEQTSVGCIRKILDAIHQNNIFAETLYSNIYDLKKGLIYVYYFHKFNDEVVVDLQEELQIGKCTIDILSLFTSVKTQILKWKSSFDLHFLFRYIR